MAKLQAIKGVSKVPNKVLYSRMSYLYQAATYLAVQNQECQEQSAKGTALDSSMEDVMKDESKAVANATEGSHQALSRRLITELRSVSLKGLMRMTPDMKHSICKNCQTLLLEGTTCTAKIENQSKGGKKPWADVLRGNQGDQEDPSKKLKPAQLKPERADLEAIESPSVKRSLAFESLIVLYNFGCYAGR
ncbi:hypothetical protein BGAL_0078g00040 [Botrytis galanthina]|uniref:Uncharacterized protein n=1 Tax=Botrytis galanthina TaxID=278940 RepID=A0A4S8R838_9HELO|nr:hypothetical protein BGAL_0078g00040 [Botrytis galanthina]